MTNLGAAKNFADDVLAGFDDSVSVQLEGDDGTWRGDR